MALVSIGIAAVAYDGGGDGRINPKFRSESPIGVTARFGLPTDRGGQLIGAVVV